MNFTKRSAPIPRSSAAAGSAPAVIPKPLALRCLMLAASVMASSMSATTYAAEPSAAEYFVAKVMAVPTANDSSSVPATSNGGARAAYASAQDQFVDRVLKGRVPEGISASQLTDTPTKIPAAWPDVGFMRLVSAP